MHAAESLVPQPQASDLEMANEKLNRHKSRSMDRIPEKFINAEVRTIHSEIQKLTVLFGIRTNCLSSGKSQPLYLLIKRMIKQAVLSGISVLSITEHILPNILQSRLTSHTDETIGDNECGL